MIRCLVIDDEPHAVQLLADYLQKSPDTTLVETFTNPIKAFHFLQKDPVELLFLDIQMPELTGVQLLKLIPKDCRVIFTTAYEQYALDAYELDVIDYLLKPISFDRFLASLEKYKQRFGPALAKATPAPYIFVKSGYRTLKINLVDIRYLEALSDYVAIHTHEGKVLTLENMRFFETTLPSPQFIRIHRSYIVALPHIAFIERNRVVIKEQYLPISKSYQKAFWKAIGKPCWSGASASNSTLVIVDKKEQETKQFTKDQ